MNVSKAFPKVFIDMKKLIPKESSCFSTSPEFFDVWLIYLEEELLAAKRNRLAVNQTFSARCFAGCLLFFKVGQGGVLEKLYRRSTCGRGSNDISLRYLENC